MRVTIPIAELDRRGGRRSAMTSMEGTTMYNASYIGRIGALAVALGVGIFAVAIFILAPLQLVSFGFAEPRLRTSRRRDSVAGPDRLDHGLDQHPDVGTTPTSRSS